MKINTVIVKALGRHALMAAGCAAVGSVIVDLFTLSVLVVKEEN